MSILSAKNLSKKIKKTSVVTDVSVEISEGEVVGLLGPNGAGKTTTFYMICGLLKPTSGSIWLDQVDISDLPLNVRSDMGIGYLPQESSIFKDLTVEDNLMVAAQNSYSDKKECRNRVEEMLEAFSIDPIRCRKGVSLSGGERRRVEIARALVRKPKFILLDEPFAGVDPIAVFDIQRIIERLVGMRIGVLITDHNVRETLGVCNRAYVIKEGSILASGDSKSIYSDPLVKKYYLGESFRI